LAASRREDGPIESDAGDPIKTIAKPINHFQSCIVPFDGFELDPIDQKTSEI
jgi:hypothetical protein